MKIEVKIPPFAYTALEWKGFPGQERALLVAAQERDTYESQEQPKGSNRGPRIDVYLTTAKAGIAQPWCAAFAYWSCVTAGFVPKVSAPASVASWAEWAKKDGRWVSHPRRGFLFAYLGEGHTHIGFVAKVNTDGSIETLEGNSNDDGSRNGWEIVRHHRQVAGIAGFINLEGLM